MFMRSVGVLMRLMKACDMGCRNLFFCIIFLKIKTFKKILKYYFWMCFLSSHAVSMNGARHNNEPAHKNKIKNTNTRLLWLFSPYRCISLLKAHPLLWRWRVSAGVLTFYPTRQIFLPRLTAHAHINISSFFSCWTTIFNASASL